MKTTKYTLQQLVAEVQRRLGVLHDVPEGYRIGKNKIVFSMNGAEVFVNKNREKTTGERKIICECLNCFPVVMTPDDKELLTEMDVERLTVALDRYFLAEELGLPAKAAICNPLHYVTEAMQPFFPESEEKEAAETIREYLAYESMNSGSMNARLSRDSTLVLFGGNNSAGARVVLIADVCDFCLRIISVPDNGGPIQADAFSEEDLTDIIIDYDTTDLRSSVALAIEGYENLHLCTAEITEYIEPPNEQQNEDDR